jgi:hypothetical protein
MTTTNGFEPSSTVPPTIPASVPTHSTESVVPTANRVLEHAEFAPGKPRQIVDAALLGMCVAFFIALLNVKLDSSLTNAVICFGGAMPLIGWGYILAARTPKPTPGWRLLQALLIGAWAAEGIGELAVYVGVLQILWHFSFAAFFAALLSSAFAIVGVPILSLIGLLIYATIRAKEEKAGKQSPLITPTANSASAIPAATSDS